MSLYEAPKIKFRMDFELFEEFEVKVRVPKGSVLSPFLFAVVVDVTEFSREGALSELLYPVDLVLMSKTIERLRNKLIIIIMHRFIKWKDYESKGLCCSSNTKYGMSMW